MLDFLQVEPARLPQYATTSGKRRRVDLACAIVTTDIDANWFAAYGIQHTSFLTEHGLHRLTVFTLIVLGTAPILRKRPTS